MQSLQRDSLKNKVKFKLLYIWLPHIQFLCICCLSSSLSIPFCPCWCWWICLSGCCHHNFSPHFQLSTSLTFLPLFFFSICCFQTRTVHQVQHNVRLSNLSAICKEPCHNLFPRPYIWSISKWLHPRLCVDRSRPDPPTRSREGLVKEREAIQLSRMRHFTQNNVQYRLMHKSGIALKCNSDAS